MTINSRDVGAGAAFITVAAIYGGTALSTLSRGTPTNMGPAAFPLILCAILVVLGVVLCVRGLISHTRVRVEGPVAWRAILVICPAVVFFAAFIREIGFAPAVVAVTFSGALASNETRPREALALSVVVAVVCVGVFIYGVRLPIPIFGTWLAG